MKNYYIYILLFLFSCETTVNEPEDTTPPQTLTLTHTTTETELVLGWTELDDDVAQYYIFLGETENNRLLHDSIVAPATSYTIINLKQHQTYYTHITAKDNAGNESSASNMVSSKLIDETAPLAPSLTVSNHTDKLVLAIQATDSDIKTLELHESINDSLNFALKESFDSKNSHTVTGLNEHTTYYYKIRASDHDNNTGAFSKIVSGRLIDINAPEKPVLSGKMLDKSVKLIWTATDTDIATFHIEQSADSLTFSFIDSVNVTTKDTIILELTNEQDYFYRIFAKDFDGNISEASNIIKLKPTDGQPLVALGWENYNSANYDSAIVYFTSVIDSNYAKSSDAFEGRGWASLYKDSGNVNTTLISNAKTDFNAVSSNQAYAGLAVLYLLEEEYASVVSTVEKMNDLDQFQHKEIHFVNGTFVRLHLAYAHYYLGNFATVKSLLDTYLEPNVTHSEDPVELSEALQRVASNIKKSNSTIGHTMFLNKYF